MNIDPVLIMLLAAALLSLVSVAWAILERRRADRADRRAWDLSVRATEAESRLRLIEDQSATQTELLRAQAANSAAEVAESLMKRAEETFRNRELLAQERIEAQLKPVADTLSRFEAQVSAVEKARQEDTGGLKAQIAALMEASVRTQTETRKLSNALRRGAGVQGRWGEQTLRNVLETAGLAEHYDFVEQFSLDTEEGRRRPDVKVRMPGGAVFAIDAKCSFTAFVEAQEAVDDVARESALARHASSVKNHMQGLSSKAYWDQFAHEPSPDFVAMFVPGDGFLAAALDRMPDLMTLAMDKKVLLVTPTTLFALCKAVAYGWRVQEQSANAEKIASLGRELYKRLSVMGTHTAALGKALEQAVGKYNQMVGSLESNVLTQARRFTELSVDHEGRDLPELNVVETAVRPLARLATPPDDLATLTILRQGSGRHPT